MRRTKIVCTLGPATKTKEQIADLADAGMDIARLNMAHGTLEEHRATIRILNELNAERAKSTTYKHCIGILVDIRGAEVRTEDVKQPLIIHKGEEVVFSFLPRPDEKRQVIQVNHKGFVNDVKGVERILLDNGELTFDLLSIETNGTVVARAREDGTIGSRRHVNLPGADLDLPSITEQDWEDIAFAAQERVDFLGLSFIRKASEVDEARTFLANKKSAVHLIAKIETRQGVENIEEIIAASDGIMVARGDLGAEVPFESVPVIQDDIVMHCRAAGKPVIVATQMLESMIQLPMPTRAEVTDMAHAVMTGTDSTMLSGETANGRHPLAAVDAMDRVLSSTESHLAESKRMENQSITTERDARAEAAVSLAVSTSAKAILVITRTGRTALDIARFRPSLPVIACTDTPSVQHFLQLSYGLVPLQLPLDDDPEQTVDASMAKAKSLGLLSSGDGIILVSDARVRSRTVNTIQVRRID
ncbi:pyruvate kinase [Candidatus Peregrinibacteria bacterium]|nr:pyruvate kinase [Candidatus Peregrinibacteria bacterium]